MNNWYPYLTKSTQQPAAVVPFDAASERIIALDFTENNTTLTAEMLADTGAFTRYIEEQLAGQGARYGIGGYDEHRTVYNRSRVFDAATPGEEPRRLHLGTDIWGPAGTPVMAPLDGVVHSFAFNNQYGDYGATIILQHQVDAIRFHTLYGHLNLASLQGLYKGKPVAAGTVIAAFGEPAENGHWPPHLHFQLVGDMQGREGDYPGVCANTDKAAWLANSPDPDWLLQLNRYVEIFNSDLKHGRSS